MDTEAPHHSQWSPLASTQDNDEQGSGGSIRVARTALTTLADASTREGTGSRFENTHPFVYCAVEVENEANGALPIHLSWFQDGLRIFGTRPEAQPGLSTVRGQLPIRGENSNGQWELRIGSEERDVPLARYPFEIVAPAAVTPASP